MLIDLLTSSDPILGFLIFLIVFSVLVFALTAHEFAHAWMATRLGDPTAKAMGRLTLNPLAHLDPLGTLLLVLGGFGWGKPVPFNPDYLANPIRDSALISIVGPLSNFLIAVVFGLIYKFAPLDGLILVKVIIEYLVQINLVLCVFNLIPVHPLDGFKVVAAIVPKSLYSQWMDLMPYGIYILLVLIFTGVTSKIISIPVHFLLNILL